MTSHDVVDAVRARFQIRRIGHAGTLDPSATGLLILLIGSATRQAQSLLGLDKTYLATLRLGLITDTLDREGRILEERPVGPLTPEEIEAACGSFRGEIEQEIPAYSAVRVEGKRFYDLARAGGIVPRRVRRVVIHSLRICQVHLPEVDLEVACSKGTYIRTLCADIGAALGCGGILSQLRRIQVGSFSVDQAIPLEDVGPQHIRDVNGSR